MTERLNRTEQSLLNYAQHKIKLKCYHVIYLIGFDLIILDFKCKPNETKKKKKNLSKNKKTNEAVFYFDVVFS